MFILTICYKWKTKEKESKRHKKKGRQVGQKKNLSEKSKRKEE